MGDLRAMIQHLADVLTAEEQEADGGDDDHVHAAEVADERQGNGSESSHCVTLQIKND